MSAIRCKCWEGILGALIVVAVEREYGKHQLWNQAHKGMASFLILSLLFISMWDSFCAVSPTEIAVYPSSSWIPTGKKHTALNLANPMGTWSRRCQPGGSYLIFASICGTHRTHTHLISTATHQTGLHRVCEVPPGELAKLGKQSKCHLIWERLEELVRGSGMVLGLSLGRTGAPPLGGHGRCYCHSSMANVSSLPRMSHFWQLCVSFENFGTWHQKA